VLVFGHLQPARVTKDKTTQAQKRIDFGEIVREGSIVVMLQHPTQHRGRGADFVFESRERVWDLTQNYRD